MERYDRNDGSIHLKKKEIPNLESWGFFSYNCSMSYVIIKMVKDASREKELPVIILDSEDDVLEFDTKEAADEMRLRFEVNSDSGYKYRVKKIGEHHDDH
jgi:hypothetical protein